MARFGRTLRVKILRSVLLTVALPAFAVMLAFYVGWNAYVLDKIKREVANSTAGIAARLESDLGAYDALLSALAADPDVLAAIGQGRNGAAAEGLPRTMAAIYAVLKDRSVKAVVSGIAPDGGRVFGTMGAPTDEGSDFTDDWGLYGLMRREAGRVVAYQRQVRYGRLTQTDWSLGLAIPSKEGKVAGYLTADLSFRESQDLSAGRAGGVTGRFILTNEFDRVVAAYDGSSVGPFERLSIEGAKGETFLEGTRYAYARTPVGLHGLSVYGLASIEFILSSFRFGLGSIGLILALFSVVLVLVLGRSVRRLTRPMNDILDTMAKVSQGDFGARLDVISGDEFEEIALRLNSLISGMEETVQRLMEGIDLAKSAEMKQLQAQFDPHFLYNTIDTAKWMIRMGETEKAQAILTDMAKVLRYSVRERPAGLTTSLREDIAIIRTYVEIHRLSLGERLEVEFDVEEAVLGCRVPPLLIQPLVENALVHGIGPAGGGRLRISARAEGGRLVIRVADTGSGFEVDRAALERAASGERGDAGAPSLGMELALRRARLHYGDRFAFDVRSGPEKGTEVSLAIPMGEAEA